MNPLARIFVSFAYIAFAALLAILWVAGFCVVGFFIILRILWGVW